MGGWAGKRGSEKEAGLRAPRRARSSAAWSPQHHFFRCFSASLGAIGCWGGRCHARGGASAMARPHAPRTPLCPRGNACAGGPVHAHGATIPAVVRARQRRKSLGRWSVSIHHADRPAAPATPWCRSGETRRLTRSLFHTTRPPRSVRTGLPGYERARVSVATDTVSPSQDYRIRKGVDLVVTLKISTLVSRHLRRLRSWTPTSNRLCGR
jgi:hypothetical protein